MTKGPEIDPLDDLKGLFEQATPAPDATRRADVLARSEEIFEKCMGRPKDQPMTCVLLLTVRNGRGLLKE